MDHALEYDHNPKKFSQNTIRYDGSDPNAFYYSPEEKRVITGSEQTTARALKEIRDDEFTRRDHFGNHVLMNSPISNCPQNDEEEFL